MLALRLAFWCTFIHRLLYHTVLSNVTAQSKLQTYSTKWSKQYQHDCSRPNRHLTQNNARNKTNTLVWKNNFNILVSYVANIQQYLVLQSSKTIKNQCQIMQLAANSRNYMNMYTKEQQNTWKHASW